MRREDADDGDLRVGDDVLAERDRLVDDDVHRHGHGHFARRARIRDEVAREAEHAARRVGDAREAIVLVDAVRLGGVFPRAHLANQVVGVSDDGRERVVQLVHDPGGDLSQRSQLLGLHHVRAHRVQLGDGLLGPRLHPRQLDPPPKGVGGARDQRSHPRPLVLARRIVRGDVQRGAPRLDLDHALVRQGREEPRRIAALFFGQAGGANHILHPTARRHDARPHGVIGEQRRQRIDDRSRDGAVPRVHRDLVPQEEEALQPRRGELDDLGVRPTLAAGGFEAPRELGDRDALDRLARLRGAGSRPLGQRVAPTLHRCSGSRSRAAPLRSIPFPSPCRDRECARAPRTTSSRTW